MCYNVDQDYKRPLTVGGAIEFLNSFPKGEYICILDKTDRFSGTTCYGAVNNSGTPQFVAKQSTYDYWCEYADMIEMDLSIMSPETNDYCACEHFTDSKGFEVSHNSSEIGGINRMYKDEDGVVRAYAVLTYGEGIAIIYNKYFKTFSTYCVSEDDGNWFINSPGYNCAPFSHKNDFIACMSEAMSMINNNLDIK